MRDGRSSPASGVRLSRVHERWVYGSYAGLLASGVLWLVFHHFVSVTGEFGPQPHRLEPWWLTAHGAAASAFGILLGTLLPVHVRRSWHARKNRRSGAVLLGAVGWLIASGCALYYCGDEALRPWLSLGHWLLGLLGGAALLAHAALGKRAMRRQAGPRAQAAARGESEAQPLRALR